MINKPSRLLPTSQTMLVDHTGKAGVNLDKIRRRPINRPVLIYMVIVCPYSWSTFMGRIVDGCPGKRSPQAAKRSRLRRGRRRAVRVLQVGDRSLHDSLADLSARLIAIPTCLEDALVDSFPEPLLSFCANAAFMCIRPGVEVSGSGM